MKNVAIIPARGGSKRIPGKNIRLFAGKPIIVHSIEAARLSGCFDRIIVSTDDEAVQRVAQDAGAEVPFKRPPELSHDTALIVDVMLNAIQWLRNDRFLPSYACCIYATAPFVRAGDIVKGFELIRAKNAAMSLAVTTFPYPIFRSLRIDQGGLAEMIWPEYKTVRSQDLPEAWHDAGQFFWLNADRFVANPEKFMTNMVANPIPRYRVQDIDTEEDWIRAELMYRILKKD